uniref:Uncharacterized protein n=1 Tax=Cucumis melo TaxID=3656 RepID=A0A9I9D112_CUCME
MGAAFGFAEIWKTQRVARHGSGERSLDRGSARVWANRLDVASSEQNRDLDGRTASPIAGRFNGGDRRKILRAVGGGLFGGKPILKKEERENTRRRGVLSVLKRRRGVETRLELAGDGGGKGRADRELCKIGGGGGG